LICPDLSSFFGRLDLAFLKTGFEKRRCFLMHLSLWLLANFDDILRQRKVSHALTSLEEKPELVFFLWERK